jgi:hypothetical protein
VRFREDTPDELERARSEVAAWRGQHPGGTGEELGTRNPLFTDVGEAGTR